jgi:hypothetical protein
LTGELERVDELGNFGMALSGLHAPERYKALNNLSQVLSRLIVTRLGADQAFDAAVD